MKQPTFERMMEFCGYSPDDRKFEALRLVMVEGTTQYAAARATDYSVTQLNAVYSRVRRELARVEKLIGGPLDGRA